MENNKSFSERYKDFLNDVFEEVYRERSLFYKTLNQSEKEKVFNLLCINESKTYCDGNHIIKSPSGVSTKIEYLDSFSEQMFSKFLSKEYSNAIKNEYEEIIDNKYKKEIMDALFRRNLPGYYSIKEKIKSEILNLEHYKFRKILESI